MRKSPAVLLLVAVVLAALGAVRIAQGERELRGYVLLAFAVVVAALAAFQAVKQRRNKSGGE